jgi:Cyclin, N-terminal domain
MIAMNYLDRVLVRRDSRLTSKYDVQLLALSCLYLAVKIFQTGPVLSTQQMSVLSGGMYTAVDVALMERDVMFTLQFCLHPPCSTDFLHSFHSILIRNKCLPPHVCPSQVLQVATKALHASVLDYFFVAHELPQSHVAGAALFNAVRVLSTMSQSNGIYSTFKMHDLVRVLRKHAGPDLNGDVVGVCQQRLWSIIDKTRYRCAADGSPPCSPSRMQTYLDSPFMALSFIGGVPTAHSHSPRGSPTSIQLR